MRALQSLLALLLSFPAVGQELINRRVLSGNGSDQPTAIATDRSGFVYVAGNTTSSNFPVSNALEVHAPQGALEVSINGAAFANVNLPATSVSAVAASSNGQLVLAGTPNGIYRSTDQGATWTAAADMVPSAVALAVDPVNPANAYAVVSSNESNNGAIYKSSNGGVNWQATGAAFLPAHGVGPQLAINPQAPATIYLLAGNLLYRSTDAARSWQPLPVPNSNEYLSGFALAPSQPNVLYATGGPVFGPLFKSSDGGSTWTQGAANVFAYGPGAMAVDPTNASTVWLVNGGVDIFKSTDGGGSFQIAATLGNNTFLTWIVIDPANPEHLYAGYSPLVYQSLDGGKNWSAINPAFSTVVTSVYAAPSRVYAAGNMPSTVFLAKLDATLSQLIYSTYLWVGTVTAMAVDAAGNIYVAGTQSDYTDGIVMEISASDHSVFYSTPLIGAVPNAIAMDANGNAVIAGAATNFAVTKGAYQSAIPGPCALQPLFLASFTNQESTHAFVAKLDPSGALVQASYITGTCGDSAFAVALDSAGAIYVAGETYSSDFPVTADAMIAKFPSMYSAGFISKLSPAFDQLIYSSFLGGGNFSAAHALTLDGAGNVYLAGSTQAIPTTAAFTTPSPGTCQPPPPGIGPGLLPPPIGGDNPFVLKMTLSAAPPAFFTTLGGTCHGEADSLVFDAAGNLWTAGSNESWDFPTLAPIGGLGQIPPQQLHYYNAQTGFLAELNPSASALLSATVTDSLGVVAADSTAVYYAAGLGDITSGVFTSNFAALVAEINPSQAASIFIDQITQDSPLLPASGRLATAVAPGEIVRIIGRGIGPQNQAKAKLTSAGTLSTSIGGVQVTFNGIAAPLVTAQANEVVAIAPFELNGLITAPVQIQYKGLTSNTYTVPVVPQNPDIIAVTNSDWSINSQTNPAKSGSGITIFLTGIGETSPPGSDGAINQPPPAQPVTVPAVTVSGAPANVTYFGTAGGEVAGVMQLNLNLPPTPEGQDFFWVAIGTTGITVSAGR